MSIINDIVNAFLPEFILLIFIIMNIIFSLFINKNTYKISKLLNVLGIIFVFISIFFLQAEPKYYAFNNSYVSGVYTALFKVLILISALFVILATKDLIRVKRQKSFEFFAILLSGIFSAFSLISSNDFLIAFISLELLSLCCYFLTSFRNNHKSKEASLKYLITGASASCFFLFGVSYLYGITGNINLTIISNILQTDTMNVFYVVSGIFILLGLFFKLACTPFINWVIDVYEGANYSVCLFLSLVPKIAVIAFLSKLFVYIFSYSPILKFLTTLIALFTIIYASIGAIKQTNIKRLYAYSSVLHFGFLLMALSLVTQYSLSTVIFYLITYIFMNIGVWTASSIYNLGYQSDEINDYKGLYSKHPYFSIAFSICLLSLAGLPPTGGFLAKIYLFSSFVNIDFLYVLILFVLLLSTVIAIFPYFNVIRILFEKNNNLVQINNKILLSKTVLYICSIVTVLFCFVPNIFMIISDFVSSRI